jgi:inorganic pyrophosphatase
MNNISPSIYLNKLVKMIIDRPLGSTHLKYPESKYLVNYGYIPDTISGDGKELDAYVLGVDVPLESFNGRCIAYIRRSDDDDDKLIIVLDGVSLTDSEIKNLTYFQEKYFKIEIFKRK